MATTAVHVSLEEYLNTEYEPDCDYVGGVLEDRNVGKQKHGETQLLLGAWLLAQAERHGKKPITEQRVRLSPFKIRIPDVCLIDRDDHDEIVQKPPALWVEIFSPDDRWSRLHRKLTEVLNFGVPTIWIIDPYDRQAWIGTPQARIVAAEENVLRCENLNLQVTLEAILPTD
jgi:Uma2 family endonuclease